jgi:hypothetical protein
MRFHVAKLKDYLRAELLDRETVEETRHFLKAIAGEAQKAGLARALICVHTSRPIFKVEEYQASAYLKELAARPEARVALLSSRMDVRAAHEYLEVLAMQQGANVRSFTDEAQAVAWLRAETPAASAAPAAPLAKTS